MRAVRKRNTANFSKQGTPGAEDFLWLGQVKEKLYPIDSAHPIFVHETSMLSGNLRPQPTVPFPERHPYCEFGFQLEGRSTQFICGEKIERSGGDILLLGPGIPHFGFCRSYPYRGITIYFLPLLLFELGPDGDGAWALSRFTTPQQISQHVIRPPSNLRVRLAERLMLMTAEFRDGQPGSQLRLWSLLIESLVEICRWESKTSRPRNPRALPQNWVQLEKALRHISVNSSRPLYIDEIAASVGLTANRLRELFRSSLGISCSDYLRSLRIHQAKSLLCLPGASVTEVALSVGFETPNHFSTTFHQLTGISPSSYMQQQHKRGKS